MVYGGGLEQLAPEAVHTRDRHMWLGVELWHHGLMRGQWEYGGGGWTWACASHACARFQLPLHTKEKEKKKRARWGDCILYGGPFGNILTRKQHPTALRSCDTNRSCLLRVFPSSPRCLHPAKWARCQSHLQPRGTIAFFSLFNEMTKQQIYICRNRCCNRFDSSWPKTCCVGENGGKRNGEEKKVY